jgi:hypothetical protein
VQVAFVTLFLGLISGSQPVALTAGGDVAAIELVLDGAVAGRLTARPFHGQVDFGTALLPHHLVARALDRQGAEVGKTEQWINLPRPPAEVEMMLEPAPEGAPRTVRLTWQSVTNQAPEAVALTLDGASLALDARHRATLPPAAAGSGTRVLSAELRFANGVVARRDVALDREFGGEVSTELTAVPVWLRSGAALPPVPGLQGWLAAAGESLQVDAVEAGGGQLLVVRDPRAEDSLQRAHAATLDRTAYTLGEGWQLQFLWPRPHVFTGDAGPASDLFDLSQPYDLTDYGVISWLGRVIHLHNGPQPARLADAVAVAGLRAYDGGKPRAVLLVLGPTLAGDASEYAGAAVRRYLAALHVPLFVWSTGSPNAAMREAWGEIENINGLSGPRRAFGKLRDALATQRILLVEGRHLPQAITLGSAAARATVDLGAVR